MGGEWIEGTVIELDDSHPSRIKVRVRLKDDTEEYVNVGRLILRGPAAERRERSRSPRGHRGRSPVVDWSRERGRSTRELLEEMRSRDREKLVAVGKDYAKKPIGFKAACALPREQGAASYKLMEEETFVPTSRSSQARPPSPERAEPMKKRTSAEHQERMRQLFEKYGNQRAQEGRRSYDDVERTDVLRFG